MDKICPYNRGREQQKYRQQNILDAEGEVCGYEYMMTVAFEPAPCLADRCGAFQRGACRYAAVSLDNS